MLKRWCRGAEEVQRRFRILQVQRCRCADVQRCRGICACAGVFPGAEIQRCKVLRRCRSAKEGELVKR